MKNIKFELHVGGKFQNSPRSQYVGGECRAFKEFDVDLLSVPHLFKTMVNLGFQNVDFFTISSLGNQFNKLKLL